MSALKPLHRAGATGVLVLTVLLWAAPAHAVTSAPAVPVPSAASVNGHLLDVAASSKPISPWVATDLTTLESVAGVAGTVTTAETPAGATLVAARTTAGHVLLFTLPATPATWQEVDVTQLASAPLAAGTPSVVVDPLGVTRIFFRTATGDLDELENDRVAPDPWFTTDLTVEVQPNAAASLAGDPTAISATGYPTTVYAEATNGDLVSFSQTTSSTRPWFFTNISLLSFGPTVKGAPAVIAAPDGFGLTAVYAESSTDQLIEFTDDDAGWHLWSARNVSTSLSLGAIASQPSALTGQPSIVAVTSATGHLVTVTIPTVALTGATVTDVSSLTKQTVRLGYTPSIAASKVGFVIAALSPASHLNVFSAAEAPPTAATVVDATAQPLTEQTVESSPVAVDIGGVTSIFTASGGYLGTTARLILNAESQDQYHAKTIESPPGSNCNPFSAIWSRGTTAGCAPGTSSEEWCSDFAQWVWQSVGIDTTGITGASKSFVTWGESQVPSQFIPFSKSAVPAVGDAVVWGVASPLYGAHVGIIVAVSGGEIDVVSGNSGPNIANEGNIAVWRSGFFKPEGNLVSGDAILGYVSPTPLPKPAVATHATFDRSASWPVLQGSGGGSVPSPSTTP